MLGGAFLSWITCPKIIKNDRKKDLGYFYGKWILERKAEKKTSGLNLSTHHSLTVDDY